MPDAIWQLIGGALLMIVMTYMQSRTSKRLDKIAIVADATHKLVNSGFGVVLKKNLDLAEWKAAQTMMPDDIADAVLSRKDYEDHVKNQKLADDQVKEK